ncbi:MAG: hypothetical protein ACD_75C01701G0002, partial [uncultured bacterium]
MMEKKGSEKWAKAVPGLLALSFLGLLLVTGREAR